MKNKFLVNWNDEYLSQSIVAGPFDESEQTEILKTEMIRQLCTYMELDSAEALKIYEDKVEVMELDTDTDYPYIDLNIRDHQSGASFIYASNYESRLEVIEYDLNNQEEGNIQEFPGKLDYCPYCGSVNLDMSGDALFCLDCKKRYIVMTYSECD